jgi:hypothetical protein
MTCDEHQLEFEHSKSSTYESAREKDRSATPDVDEVPRRNGREDVD